MIKLFYKLFNHDKIDKLNEVLDTYKERNEQLESELEEYKGYKLKYQVTKLYVEDDDALLELFTLAEEKEKSSNTVQLRDISFDATQHNTLTNHIYNNACATRDIHTIIDCGMLAAQRDNLRNMSNHDRASLSLLGGGGHSGSVNVSDITTLSILGYKGYGCGGFN